MKAESCESEAFRQCFRRFCYEDVSGPREAFSKLWELCCRWLKPEARSKEQMLELLVIEQFLTILPEKIQAWALTRRPESGEEAVALVLRLEKEAGRPKQLCSPVHSKKPDPRGVVWDLAECRPEAHPRVVSREEARSLHSGQQEWQNPRREHRPVTKNDNDQKAQPSPWASIPAEEWSSLDQETTTMKLLAGSQAAARGAHAVRGVAHKKSTRQAPPHRDLCRDVGEGSVGNTVALGSAAPTASKMAQEEQRREPWATRPHPANKRSFMKGELVHAAQVPARSAGAAWREQQPWAVDDEKVAGVHWSYEETKTFLAILKESRFYETLQACPRNSQVYGAVAEWLRECGFLRTPEQCRTKFKSLQKSYRKVRNGHGLEPCAFYEDMDALLNPAARAPCAGKPKGHVSLRALRRTGSGTTEQTGLQGADRATDCSDGEEAGIEFIRKSEVRGAPVLFQTLSGVHWGYEETKTFLNILRETRFYDALQACHRKSRLYGAVAERLRACGFLRTPEQCRTKFKSLQKSYRKVKSGHLLESCAFYEDMDALINSWASGPSTSTPGEGLPPSRQDREDIEIEPREPAGWEPEETSQEAIVEDSGSERMSEEELARESEFRGPPGLQQSPGGFETGGRRREAATQAVCEGTEPHRACREPSKRGVSQNTDLAKSHEAECTVGRQGKLASQPRDAGRAVVHQKPFTGRRPYRLLKYGESSGRGARLLCRTGHQKENSYKCNVCGKCFGRGRSLVRHQRIHTGEKPFKCLDCGKSFNDSSNFGAHQRVHTGEKPFGCGQCGKRFSQSSSLVIHQRTHTGEKPYQCGERAKSFTNSSHISARRRVHAGEGPSRCRDCEKGFSSCTRVREHRGTHAGGASCGRQFSKSSILTRHQEGHAREKLQPRPPSPHSSENPHKGRTDDFRKTF